MAALEVWVTPAPAHWAGYLINNDRSNITEGDMQAADAWFWGVEVWETEGEPWFSWNSHLYGSQFPGGMLVNYVVASEEDDNG